MKLAHTFTSLLALVSLVASSPTQQLNTHALRLPLERRNNQITVESLRAHLAQVSAKYRQGFAAYQANEGHAHPLSKPSSSKKVKRDAGDVFLIAQGIELWYASIDVGSPAVTFTVSIDTGSADLFLPSTACVTTCDGHTKYDPSNSSTAIDLKKSFVLTYGQGEVAGEEYTDNVVIGGYKAEGQTIGAASNYSSDFSSENFVPDGLVGFAFESISEYGASPLFQTLLQRGGLREAVFGVKLSATSNASELFVGGINTTLYQQNTLTYIPITKEGYWQVTLDQVSRAGVSVGTSGATSIIDTGTTLIVTDMDSAASYFDGIPGVESYDDESEVLYSIPCDTIDNYAPTLTFGGHPFTVSGETFNLGPVEQGSSDCLAGVAGSNEVDFWVVGDVFLQNVYSIYDMDGSRVGFAELA
ncbi:aspartic peptidase domain-containing protein [Suillus paluster]|uniref:aspartic peptidase domain-containing protein n=1 Tax=Suillus paluster TaxID=48578 RepID=UPI001B85BB83|nr:aspartic peptidase domain-containing protein [Suillus paluster]KAG1730838.1 aspartic peptidase domain-containing protein [Suillus paluster]